MARNNCGRRPVSRPNMLHLYFFSVGHGRYKDYISFLFKVLGLWFIIWLITSHLLGLLCLALLSTVDDTPYFDFAISTLHSIANTINCWINSDKFIPLLIQGTEGGYVDFFDIIAYTAGAIISGYLLIKMICSKRIITIADKIALTTIHSNSDDNAADDKKIKDDKCLVFRFATGGSTLYNIKAVLDFADEDARNNPIDPRIDHPIFEIPNGNDAYSELIGVHELYFPFDTKPKNGCGKTLGEFYTEHTNSNASNNMAGLSATLRIIANTASGIPVNSSNDFSIFIEENRRNIVIEGEFKPTLQTNRRYFKHYKRYHFKYFNEVELIKLTNLTARVSLTYGETLKVPFTPKSGDDAIASGTATLKLGDKVLATSSEPQEGGSFLLTYETARKGIAPGKQALTVTFKGTGHKPVTEFVETTLSPKALPVSVTSCLDKTWDGSDEVDGLVVKLLDAPLEGDVVTVSVTGAYASPDAGEQDVTLTLALSGDDAAWYTVSAPGLAGTINAAGIAGKLSLSGTPVFGETLTATYEPASGEQVSYAWTRDGRVIDGVTGSIYTLTREDVGARIAVVATASDANHAGSVTSHAVTVVKAAQDAPAAPAATATSHTTIEVEALADSPAGAKAEYSIDGGRTWQTETTFSGLDPETEYTVIARYQELDTHEASEVSEGTTVSTPAAPLPTFIVSVSAEGQGTVDGGGTYERGTSVTVTATAAEGHHFVAWLVDGEQVSAEASYTFVVEADVALVAQFEQHRNVQIHSHFNNGMSSR